MDWFQKGRQEGRMENIRLWMKGLKPKQVRPPPIPIGNIYDTEFPSLKEQRAILKKSEVLQKPFDSGHGFIHALERKGFKKLGQGAFSVVLAKPDSKRVIKVTRRIEDDGWIDYIKWADKKGYTGSFAPKVYSYKYIKGRERDFAISSMERMKSSLGSVGYQHDATVLWDLIHKATNDNQLATRLLNIAVPGLDQFNKDLRKTFGALDLHSGNLMVRENGSLVFTDPVGGYTAPPTRERLKFAA